MKISLPLLMLLAFASAAVAQEVRRERDPSCDDWRGDRARYCEVREIELPTRDRVEVDAGRNGGIRVEGWDRPGIMIRARVQAWDDESEAAARRRVDEVRIETGAVIRASGPSSQRWAVSYDLFVPRRTALRLEAHNGGIGVSEVRGGVSFRTMNGGVTLARVSGHVRGETTNGGVHVILGGATWEGQGLDVRTVNGGVHLEVPEGYSARLETGTVNGGIRFDFPVMVEGRIGREFALDLGRGGPLVRAKTTNGGVVVTRPQS